jgi:DNA-binding NarL/FixJ family response regulator
MSTDPAALRVLIADDQELVRSGFRLILDSQPDMEVVAEAGDGRAALALARELHPDLVLMDVRMPVMDGIEATRQLLADPGTRTRVLMLTTFDSDSYVYDAVRAGASGFLLKDASAVELLAAVRTVARGDASLAPAVTARLLAQFSAGPSPVTDRLPADLASLTEREVDVTRLIALGLTNAEIAGRLFLGETTVKSHVTSILAKLGARDRVQVVVRCYETGWVRPGHTQA